MPGKGFWGRGVEEKVWLNVPSDLPFKGWWSKIYILLWCIMYILGLNFFKKNIYIKGETEIYIQGLSGVKGWSTCSSRSKRCASPELAVCTDRWFHVYPTHGRTFCWPHQAFSAICGYTVYHLHPDRCQGLHQPWWKNNKPSLRLVKLFTIFFIITEIIQLFWIFLIILIVFNSFLQWSSISGFLQVIIEVRNSMDRSSEEPPFKQAFRPLPSQFSLVQSIAVVYIAQNPNCPERDWSKPAIIHWLAHWQ